MNALPEISAEEELTFFPFSDTPSTRFRPKIIIQFVHSLSLAIPVTQYPPQK